MSASYRGECDKCGKETPEFLVQVNKPISGDSETVLVFGMY